MVAQLKSQRKFKRNNTKWRSDTRLTKEQRQMIRDNLPLVRLLARRMSLKIAKSLAHRQLLFDDFYSIGVEALCYAVDRFDPDKGFKFSTYASNVVISDINKYFARDMAKGISVGNEYRLDPRKVLGPILSIDQKVSADDNDMLLIEAIPCNTSKKVLETTETAIFTDQVLAVLNDREREVFELYFFENLSFKAIAKKLRVHWTTVSRVFHSGKAKIKAKFTNL